MPSLLELPVELVSGIVCTLCPNCSPSPRACLIAHCTCASDDTDLESVAALAHLCQTSRLLNTIATPHLYHRPSCTKWWLLARTLIARPRDLSGHVKHLSDLSWEPVSRRMYGEAFPKEVPTHFPSSRLARALSRDPALPKAPDQNLCRADIKGELEFVWERYERVDMLSYLCPNLEEFEVSTAERNNIWFSVAPGSLMRLTHLSLSDLGPGLTQKFAQLCQIAAVAPNLRSLVCYRVSQAMRFISEPNTFARLTELRFYHANISARALRHFLAACPELRSFTYIASGYSAGIVEAKPSAIQDAIIRHAPNLVFLSLYLWRYSVENIQNESDSGAEDQVVDSSPLNTSTKMTSFARLSKLEHLALDTRCILPDPVMTSPGQGDNWSWGEELPVWAPIPDADSMFLLRLLPPSIRSLRLAGSPSNVPAVFPSCGVGPLRAALVRLVSVVPDKFPMLKEVMLEALGKEEFRDVRVLFEKQGVVVELESAHEVCEHWIYK